MIKLEKIKKLIKKRNSILSEIRILDYELEHIISSEYENKLTELKLKECKLTRKIFKLMKEAVEEYGN